MAQVCYNEVWLIGYPSSFGSFSSAITDIFRLSHFHLFPLRAYVLRITSFPDKMGVPPFRTRWRPHIPPFGCVCVCVTLRFTGNLSVLCRGSGLSHPTWPNEAGIWKGKHQGTPWCVPTCYFSMLNGICKHISIWCCFVFMSCKFVALAPPTWHYGFQFISDDLQP